MEWTHGSFKLEGREMEWTHGSFKWEGREMELTQTTVLLFINCYCYFTIINKLVETKKYHGVILSKCCGMALSA